MAKPTVSIIVPVYNEERYLDACLDAIARQTVAPDEVILVNNNSTDNSLKIAQQFPFVRVVDEKEQGIVYARNKGFDNVKSEIIARIDADTILPANWVERVHTFYKDGRHPKTALTGGGYFYNFRLQKFNGWLQGQLAFRMNRFIAGFYVLWGSNMAMPRHFWDEVKHDVCLRNDIHEDLDLAIHLHNLGYHIHYQENLRVGVALKRIWTDRKYVHQHMRRWPTTMKIHGFKWWWLGVIGNVFLWFIVQPIGMSAEYIGRLFGRPSLK